MYKKRLKFRLSKTIQFPLSGRSNIKITGPYEKNLTSATIMETKVKPVKVRLRQTPQNDPNKSEKKLIKIRANHIPFPS